MIMIDIETLGLKPGSVIPTIGYCVFNWEGIIDRGTFAVDIENGEVGEMDVSTVKFWLQGDPAAIVKTFFRTEPPPQPFAHALSAIGHLIKLPEVQADQGVWANGPTFDLTHLDHWYHRYGLKTPWHYRSPRCMRTFCEVANRLTGWDMDVVRKRLQQEHANVLTAHDAEDDAVLQAMLVIDANSALVNLRRE